MRQARTSLRGLAWRGCGAKRVAACWLAVPLPRDKWTSATTKLVLCSPEHSSALPDQQHTLQLCELAAPYAKAPSPPFFSFRVFAAKLQLQSSRPLTKRHRRRWHLVMRTGQGPHTIGHPAQNQHACSCAL